MCLCNNIGLVSLILLGCELHVSYHCISHPDLSPLLLMPSLYSTFHLLVNVLANAVFCRFNHNDIHQVTELYLSSFMFVSAAVSEIHESNQNKEEE